MINVTLTGRVERHKKEGKKKKMFAALFYTHLSLSRLIINLDPEKSPPAFISSQRASRTSILNFSAVSWPTAPYLEILRRYYAARAKFVAAAGQTQRYFAGGASPAAIRSYLPKL